jgi:hypothetical protein
MLIGAHSIIYSTKPDADRDFLRDVLKLTHVDVGRGWLIFGLPPSEIAVHPSENSTAHELYLMCDDIEAFVAAMKARQIACAPVSNQGWGLLTELTLPGGGSIGVYQPRHARPDAISTSKPRRRKAARARKTVKRAAPRKKVSPKRKARARG